MPITNDDGHTLADLRTIPTPHLDLRMNEADLLDLFDLHATTTIAQREYEARREDIRAATKRIQLILDTPPHLLDERSFVRCTNDDLDNLQSFLRDNLEVTNDEVVEAYFAAMPEMPRELCEATLNDLRLIWSDPFSRDTISNWAIRMSLCPMHFCDWAICFDDDDLECSQIRAIFPFGHDT